MGAASKLRWNVLVFPGGTEVGMEIGHALGACKEVCLFSASSSQNNHAEYVYANHTILPDVRSAGWLEALNALIKKHKIDYLFPAHVYVIDALNKVRDQLACPAILASPEAIHLTRSKRRTLQLLKDSVDIPTCYNSSDEVLQYPVFVKPEEEYGQVGAQVIYSSAELESALERRTDLLVQELLPGAEYTIDCFSSRDGKLLYCAGRVRARIRMGTSMHGYFAEAALQEKFQTIADIIISHIPLTGAWFFQVKEDKNGVLRLLEVEPRIAGTMVISRMRGINFPLLSLYQASGKDVQILLNKGDITIDRALTNRYRHAVEYDTVYVDLDDTLLLHGKLNIQLLSFLYSCVNRNIKLVLISKSLAADKLGVLRQWRIEALFDEVYWLKESESKAAYIKVEKAIFIDDSFSARKEVAEKCDIPTFDASMVEVLLDEKV